MILIINKYIKIDNDYCYYLGIKTDKSHNLLQSITILISLILFEAIILLIKQFYEIFLIKNTEFSPFKRGFSLLY